MRFQAGREGLGLGQLAPLVQRRQFHLVSGMLHVVALGPRTAAPSTSLQREAVCVLFLLQYTKHTQHKQFQQPQPVVPIFRPTARQETNGTRPDASVRLPQKSLKVTRNRQKQTPQCQTKTTTSQRSLGCNTIHILSILILRSSAPNAKYCDLEYACISKVGLQTQN